MHKDELSIAHLPYSRVVVQVGTVWVVLNVLDRVRYDVALHLLCRLCITPEGTRAIEASDMRCSCPAVKLLSHLIVQIDDLEEIFVCVKALLLAVMDLRGKLQLAVAADLSLVHAALLADQFR